MSDHHSVIYRLYPKKEQEMMLNHFLDGTRNLYNRLVEICISYKEHNKPLPSEFDLIRMAIKIRQRNSRVHDIHSNCFQSTAKRVYRAFAAWRTRYKEGVGFPRFKSWKMFDSFTYDTGGCFSFVGRNGEKDKRERLRLGKIGLLKYSNPFEIKGNCKTATVFRRRIGNHFEWFVSISYENEGFMRDTVFVDPLFKRKDAGIDLGLDNLVTISDGVTYSNDHTYKRKEDDFAKIQRRLSNYEEDTPEYQKTLTKLVHKYKKLRNYRNDLFHKISKSISEHYNNIYMEDLSVKEMTEASFKGMKKSFRDAGWNIFTKMIVYKVEETGNNVIFVNPAYTSQLCSSCGTMVPKDLSVRTHVCTKCGLIMSRDQNAAINILNRGLGLQTETGNSLKCHEG